LTCGTGPSREPGGGPGCVGLRRCPDREAPERLGLGGGQAPPAVTIMSVTNPTIRPSRTPA
jgi:hypothetical protein